MISALTSHLRALRASAIRIVSGTRIRGARGNRLRIARDAQLHGCDIRIDGRGNLLAIAADARLWGATIRIVGDNNAVIIGAGVRLREGCKLVVEDGVSGILIGDRTTMTGATLVSSEHQGITFGEDCMVSEGTIIRSSDGHSLLDEAGRRINPAEAVHIGSHVWIGLGARVLKGAHIGDNSMIGAGAVVTRRVPARCLAVGTPATVIRRDIGWSRERIPAEVGA